MSCRPLTSLCRTLGRNPIKHLFYAVWQTTRVKAKSALTLNHSQRKHNQCLFGIIKKTM